MEEQLKKIKTKAFTVIILGLLAVTWQFLSYITIKDHINMADFSSIEAILIYSSYFFLAIFLLAVLSLIFSAFRISMKYKSEKRKEEKTKEELPKPVSEDETPEL